MGESIETIVIGAGQAGMATSFLLKQQGREHIVLEKAGKPANAWRSERWDSFTFVTPNWSFRLPGGEYDGPDPEGFMTRDELVTRFDRYAETHRLPIAYNTCVTAVQPVDGGGFTIHTDGKEYHARNLVVANGWFGQCIIPAFAQKIPAAVTQLRSTEYRRPQALPAGAVLVVGSGQSGAQIAEELYQSGRKVFMATGRAPHAPRRYRGKDMLRWIIDTGFVERTYEQMQLNGKGFVAPLISGKDGGHSLNLHIFYRDGVTLLGRTQDYLDGKLVIAPDLQANLAQADKSQKMLLGFIDQYIEQNGLDAPQEQVPDLRDGYQAAEISSLDLRAEGINTIVWACGYRYDASLFKFPVLNQIGLVNAAKGASVSHPGLYFAGFPFQPGLGSGFTGGVARSTAAIVERIAGKAISSPAA